MVDEPTRLHDERRHRAEVKSQYTDWTERFEASWRAVWAEATGGRVSFEEWFFTEGADGESPFEVAGGWFVDDKGASTERAE